MPNEIRTISLLLPFNLGDVNCYLVNSGDGFVLIDTGMPASRTNLERELESAGCKPGTLKLIVITHGDFDHTGNCAYLREKYGTKIAMHRGETEVVEHGDMLLNRTGKRIATRILTRALFSFITLFLGRFERFKPDIYIEDGQALSEYGFDAKVLHLPGHSKGSIGIVTSGDDLFCGDLLWNKDQPAPQSNIDEAVELNASIEKLKGLRINTVYPGHGKPFPMASFIKNHRPATVTT
ncbi:MAG: MBL fold metallo-hydrolase [Chloroflexi bacterium]|nr:MBL fold metallo-hydrolase [Chloroflexota bacterium]